VDFQHAGYNTNRIFIVAQRAFISVFPNASEVAEKSVFLNIASRVKDQGNEQVLLGFAFYPDYDSNGYFYVIYTASSPNRTLISGFQDSSGNPNVADANRELMILEIPQPFSNHNGGQLSFGSDGYLYIARGMWVSVEIHKTMDKDLNPKYALGFQMRSKL
jgi:glucose/arabinose dehydrogenase